jgi:osmoprotectant transport system ATP-binding protein
LIEFDGVTKVFPDGTTAVDNLNLTLPSGKITVFVGPSGCGKTTSLRMINRMVEPTSGRILIDGADVMSRDPAVMRRSIGYVIQHAGLFPHRTIAENIATVPRLLGVNRSDAMHAAIEVMGRVGLPSSFATRYPVQLSGGQQQRVGVARALASDPPVLLMDEPFSAVDPIVREELQTEFLRLQCEIGKTIALVTHDIDEAIRLGDHIAIFREHGHLAQFATPQQLLENPANEFVANFVGRDRGFRSLSFETAEKLVTDSLDSLDDRGLALVVDDHRRPVGWAGPGVGSINHPAAISGTFTQSDSLRQVTDVVISSPVGVAVRVNEAGIADGVLSHEGLFEQLAMRRLGKVRTPL